MVTNISWSALIILQNGQRLMHSQMQKHTPASLFCTIISLQGRNFETKLFHELCVIAGFTKSKTTPFHPRSDGQAERLNRTLLQMLRTTASQHAHNWPNYLPTLMSAYRMTVHSVTGVTPNEAMLGRKVLTPATLIAQPPHETHKLTVPYVTSFRNTIREAHTRIRHCPLLQ